MKILYCVDDDDGMYELEISDGSSIYRPIEQRTIAELCADDYESNHDGWDDTWPLIFSLHEPDTQAEVARLKVEKEFYPSFSAIPESSS